MRRAPISLVVLALLAAACRMAPGPSPKPAPARSDVRIGVRGVAGLDPARLRSPAEMLIARQVFEPLLDFDPSTLELKPGLAAAWSVLDGGRRFWFELRPGARFHDGSAVDASDVAASLSRLARRETGSEVAWLLKPVMGFEAVASGAAADLEGVVAVDSDTVEVRLTSPWIDFPYVLTNPATAPVPLPAAADPGFPTRPVGTGPFAVTQTLDPSGVGLEPFGGYAGERPRLSAARFLIYEDAEGAWQDFAAGRLDVADVPPTHVDEARTRLGSDGFAPVAAAVYLGLNVRGGALAEPRLRRAVGLAIDRELLAREVFEGTVSAATGIVPDGIAERERLPCGDACGHDRPRAAAVLAEAYPGGGAPTLRYDFPAGQPHEAVARAVKAQLSAVGIAVELRPRPLDEYLDLLDADGQELFRLTWVAEYPLADWFLSPLFASASPDNHTGYAVPEVDALLERARTAPDREQRITAYREVERRVLEDLPLIPLAFFRSHLATAPGLRGLRVDPLGTFRLDRLWWDAP